MDAEYFHKDDAGEGCDQHMHYIDEKRVETQDAEEAEDIPFLKVERQDDHAKAADQADAECEKGYLSYRVVLNIVDL